MTILIDRIESSKKVSPKLRKLEIFSWLALGSYFADLLVYVFIWKTCLCKAAQHFEYTFQAHFLRNWTNQTWFSTIEIDQKRTVTRLACERNNKPTDTICCIFITPFLNIYKPFLVNTLLFWLINHHEFL